MRANHQRVSYHGYPNKLLTVFRKDVVTARNELAKQGREIDAERLPFDPRYVLWVDDDAWWPSGSIDQAVTILETNADVSHIAAMNSARKKNDSVAHILYAPVCGDWYIHPMAYEPGELIRVGTWGGHWGLMRRELLTQVGNDPFDRIPLGEVHDSFRRYHKAVASDHGSPSASRLLAPEDFSFSKRVGVLQPLLTKAGLPKIGLHDLRRCGNSLLASSGVSLKTLQARLGHSTSRTILDVYTSYYATDGHAAAIVMDGLLDPGLKVGLKRPRAKRRGASR